MTPPIPPPTCWIPGRPSNKLSQEKMPHGLQEMVKGDAEDLWNGHQDGKSTSLHPKNRHKDLWLKFFKSSTPSIQKETPAPCRAAVLHTVIHHWRNSQQRIYQDPAQAHRTTLAHQPHGVRCYLCVCGSHVELLLNNHLESWQTLR